MSLILSAYTVLDNHTAFARSAILETLNMDKFQVISSMITNTFAPVTTVMHSTASTLDMKITTS